MCRPVQCMVGGLVWERSLLTMNRECSQVAHLIHQSGPLQDVSGIEKAAKTDFDHCGRLGTTMSENQSPKSGG